MKGKIKELEGRIRPYQSGNRKVLSEGDVKKLEATLVKHNLEWKKRKRGCTEVVDTISESAEMNRREFMKKVGVETDEENRVVCPL